jgi:hypothetical protein
MRLEDLRVGQRLVYTLESLNMPPRVLRGTITRLWPIESNGGSRFRDALFAGEPTPRPIYASASFHLE